MFAMLRTHNIVQIQILSYYWYYESNNKTEMIIEPPNLSLGSRDIFLRSVNSFTFP